MFVRPKQVGTIQLSALGGFCLTREKSKRRVARSVEAPSVNPKESPNQQGCLEGGIRTGLLN